MIRGSGGGCLLEQLPVGGADGSHRLRKQSLRPGQRTDWNSYLHENDPRHNYYHHALARAMGVWFQIAKIPNPGASDPGCADPVDVRCSMMFHVNR